MHLQGKLFTVGTVVLVGVLSVVLPGHSQLTQGPSLDTQVYISDKYTSPNTRIRSLQNVSNPAFRAFISKTLEGLQGRFGRYAISPDSKAGLHFVRIAVASSGDRIPAQETSPGIPIDNACTIDSPWAKVAISSNPVPQVYGTFLWNERQILQDRALLEHITSEPSVPRQALPRSLFEQLAQEYANNEILRMPSERTATLSAESIPSDVLWLFRHSPQSTRGLFSSAAEGTMRQIAERAASFYAELGVALVNRCFHEPHARYEYKSIFDIQGLISPEGDIQDLPN